MNVRHTVGRARRKVARTLHGRDDVPAAPSVDHRADQWFWDHYEWAANEVVAFFAEDAMSLEGRDVADVGCGDGITDLGLVHRARPRRFVGFDVNPVRTDLLIDRARAAGVADELPPELEFVECGPDRLPADDDSFDFVVTWSAFEHIDDPVKVLREIRRVLRPHGTLFLQLWPFYHSQHGAHLDEWYPRGFVQFVESPEAIRADVTERADDKGWAKYKLDEFEALNRISVDDLGRALRAAGFTVAKLQLMHERVHLPPEVRDLDLSLVGISGVVLLAYVSVDEANS
jgi:ubiquinone/menaquinone biosynthesis C-methylase UbiE